MAADCADAEENRMGIYHQCQLIHWDEEIVIL